MEFNTDAFREKLFESKGDKSYPKFEAETGIPQETLYAIMKRGGTPNLCTLYKILTTFNWDIKQFEK